MILQPGAVAGLYEVERELGGGGMARVYRVRHQVLGSVHALKVLEPELAVNAELRARFLDEGRIQAQLRHPNIVQVTDIVSAPGIAGLVMDFLEGQTLEAFIESREGRPPEAREVRDIFRQVLAGVGFAHREGYVHRDLKPSNIFLQQVHGQRVVRILDFGIAKAPGPEGQRATRTGARLGTPHYMSPEQVKDPRDATVRSDIFSLGVTLYELATGRRCFTGDSDFLIMRSIVQGEFLPPGQVFPGLDPGLAAVIGKAMEQDPARRFASCGEFEAALDAPPPPAVEPARRFTLSQLQAVSPVAERSPPWAAAVTVAQPSPPPPSPEPASPRAVAKPSPPPPPPSRQPKPPRLAASRFLSQALTVVGLLGLYGVLLVGLAARHERRSPATTATPAGPEVETPAAVPARREDPRPPAPELPSTSPTSPPAAAPLPSAPEWGVLSVEVSPPEGVQLTLTPPEGETRVVSAASVQDSQAMPGWWKVRAEAPGYQPKELVLEVVPGEARAGTLTLEPVAPEGTQEMEAQTPVEAQAPEAAGLPPSPDEAPQPGAEDSDGDDAPSAELPPQAEAEPVPMDSPEPVPEVQPATGEPAPEAQAEVPPESEPGEPQRFSVQGFTLFDTRTGRLWTRYLSEASYSWEEAQRYCGSLVIAGGSWRLPERSELAELVRDEDARRALAGVLAGARGKVWSATPFPGALSTQLAWTAHLVSGDVQGLRTSQQVRVLCIR